MPDSDPVSSVVRIAAKTSTLFLQEQIK